MRVRVHWNLHKGGLVIRNVPNRKGDMIYTSQACVKNARFVVSAAGLRRIRARKQREVIAWVEGDLCNCDQIDGCEVRFNPYVNEAFFTKATNRALKAADHVGLQAIGQGKGAAYVMRARNAR